MDAIEAAKFIEGCKVKATSGDNESRFAAQIVNFQLDQIIGVIESQAEEIEKLKQDEGRFYCCATCAYWVNDICRNEKSMMNGILQTCQNCCAEWEDDDTDDGGKAALRAEVERLTKNEKYLISELDEKNAEINNFLTFGQGGASFKEAQLLNKLSIVEAERDSLNCCRNCEKHDTCILSCRMRGKLCDEWESASKEEPCQN